MQSPRLCVLHNLQESLPQMSEESEASVTKPKDKKWPLVIAVDIIVGIVIVVVISLCSG